MVTAAQDLWNGPTTEVRRPGELRLFEQAAPTEALRQWAGLVAHHAWNQARDRLHHQACRHFPAGQDDVADAQLTVDEVLADAVVDPLVPTAQQAESVVAASSSARA